MKAVKLVMVWGYGYSDSFDQTELSYGYLGAVTLSWSLTNYATSII